MRILYRPEDGVAADFIPFYWNGDYHLFYLKDYRDPENHGEGTPWWQIVTRDFVRFEDWGESIARGPVGSPDLWIFTGSVIERNGLFHIFYTAHNHHMKDTGGAIEAVAHATSPDLRNWTKDERFLFFAPEEYEPDDWRDPFVFWNEDASEYWMLLAARKRTGPSRNRGCTALAASPDLKSWEVREPFWSPDEYYTHECPDLFRIGNWWYLVYSTFSERCVTHYRMSRSLQGPWLAPSNDTFDGRAYYAAKTAGDSNRRFVFGWLPTREGETDTGGWQWGGDLVVHELIQREDGTLTVKIPERLPQAFTKPVAIAPSPRLGKWQITDDEIFAAAQARSSMLMIGPMPDECLIEATIDFEPGSQSFGLLLRSDEGMDSYYQIRFEPCNQRMVIDRWPRPGDQPFMLERPLKLTPGETINLKVLVDGSCLVVYAGDEVALSCRMYEHPQGGLGLFVTEGAAGFRYLRVLGR